MNIKENNNLSTSIDSEREQRNVLDNFLNVYKKFNYDFKILKVDINNINKNLEKIINIKNDNNVSKIVNNLMIMISDASRNLSNILLDELIIDKKYFEDEVKNLKNNYWQKLKLLKDDFFGKSNSDTIYNFFSLNNASINSLLNKFNRNFYLSKVYYDDNGLFLNIKEKLNSYYTYIFKNIFWLRCFLKGEKKNENLNIFLAILSLLLINGFTSKISFNVINSEYKFIVTNDKYKKLKFSLKSDNLKIINKLGISFNIWYYSSNSYNLKIIKKLGDFFSSLIKKKFSDLNSKINYNYDLDQFDNFIVKIEKLFNLYSFKNLNKKINALKELKNKNNYEELSLLQLNKNFWRNQYLNLFYQWNLLIFNLKNFLIEKLRLIEINKENNKIFFSKNWDYVPKEDFSNIFENLALIFNGYRHSKELFYNCDNLGEKNKEFDELLIFVLDQINALINNFKKIAKYEKKEYKNKNESEKELVIDWFFIKNIKEYKKNVYLDLDNRKSKNIKKINEKNLRIVLNDHESMIILYLSRLIYNFKKNLEKIIKNKENYFNKKEDFLIKKIKIFTKENFNNKQNFNFDKEKYNLFNKDFFDNQTKNLISSIFQKIESVKKTKNSKYVKFNNLKKIDFFKEDKDFKIQFKESKKINDEFKNFNDLEKFIEDENNKKLKENLFEYYKTIFKNKNFNDKKFDKKLFNQLIEKRGILEAEKYYIYKLDSFEKLKEKITDQKIFEKEILFFFNRYIFPNLKKFDDKLNYKNWLEELYRKRGFVLLKDDKNLLIFDKYLKMKKYNNLEEILINIYKSWCNKERRDFINNDKPFSTLLFFEYFKKEGVIIFTNNQEFKNSFYLKLKNMTFDQLEKEIKSQNIDNKFYIYIKNEKEKRKYLINLLKNTKKYPKNQIFKNLLFEKYFKVLNEYFDSEKKEFKKSFNISKIKQNSLKDKNYLLLLKKIKYEFLENNNKIKQNYFSNLNLNPIISYKLKYNLKSDILNLGNNFESSLDNGKLNLDKNNFDKLLNLFDEKKCWKDKYSLIYKELLSRKYKESKKIESKGINYKFIVDAKVKRFRWEKTTNESNYKIKNIEIVDKINSNLLSNY